MFLELPRFDETNTPEAWLTSCGRGRVASNLGEGGITVDADRRSGDTHGGASFRAHPAAPHGGCPQSPSQDGGASGRKTRLRYRRALDRAREDDRHGQLVGSIPGRLRPRPPRSPLIGGAARTESSLSGEPLLEPSLPRGARDHLAARYRR